MCCRLSFVGGEFSDTNHILFALLWDRTSYRESISFIIGTAALPGASGCSKREKHVECNHVSMINVNYSHLVGVQKNESSGGLSVLQLKIDTGVFGVAFFVFCEVISDEFLPVV